MWLIFTIFGLNVYQSRLLQFCCMWEKVKRHWLAFCENKPYFICDLCRLRSEQSEMALHCSTIRHKRFQVTAVKQYPCWSFPYQSAWVCIYAGIFLFLTCYNAVKVGFHWASALFNRFPHTTYLQQMKLKHLGKTMENSCYK